MLGRQDVELEDCRQKDEEVGRGGHPVDACEFLPQRKQLRAPSFLAGRVCEPFFLENVKRKEGSGRRV